MTTFIQALSRLDAHGRLLAALAAALVTGLATPVPAGHPTHLALIWIAFSATLVALIWLTFVLSHPRQVIQLASLQDSSRTWIFALVLSSAFASLWTILVLLTHLQSLSADARSRHFVLSIIAIFSSWMLVHSLFALRYAHLYYDSAEGSLAFPATPNPDYLDFAYFSFIIGMTSQVSDVAIRSRPTRRLALLHGFIAFLFNTVLIALTINSLAGLLQA